MGRLARDTILKILVEHNQGEKRSVIAARYEIDSSTVKYHVEQFEKTYGSTAGVYSLIKPVQRKCEHPSSKCLICGKAIDQMRREEKQEITRLRSILATHGIDPGPPLV